MKKDICRALCALACADDGERGGRDDFVTELGVNRLKQREDGRQTIQINMVE